MCTWVLKEYVLTRGTGEYLGIPKTTAIPSTLHSASPFSRLLRTVFLHCMKALFSIIDININQSDYDIRNIL